MYCIPTWDLRQCSHIELTALSYGLLATQFPCLPQSERRQLPESLPHSPSHILALSSNPSDFAECLILSCLHLAAAPCPSQSLNILFILQGKAFPRSPSQGQSPQSQSAHWKGRPARHCHTTPLRLICSSLTEGQFPPGQLFCSLPWMAPVLFQSSVYLPLSV